MKGVVLGICPDVTLVDITHDMPPHDVLDGALELAASYRYLPAGTIFLAVVDPGVGSARRGIAAEAGDYRFVAPDNGVLTAVLRETAAEAGRRAHRAPLRAADGQPHVRGARSLRARGGVAGEGHPADRARPHRDRRTSVSTFRWPRSAATTLCAAWSCASIGSATSSPTSIAGRSRRSPRRRPVVVDAPARTGRPASWRPTPRSAPASVCALFGSTDHLELAVNGGERRRAASALARGAIVDGRALATRASAITVASLQRSETPSR